MSKEKVIIVPSPSQSRRSSRKIASFFAPAQQSAPATLPKTPYLVEKEMSELFLKHGSVFNPSLPAESAIEAERVKMLRQEAESIYDELEALSSAIIQGNKS